jgi:hypothetical protein
MSYLVIKQGANVVAVLEGATVAELKDHIRNGYPELYSAYLAGEITGEVVDTPPDPSVIVEPDTEEFLTDLLVSKLGKIMLNHENRIRVLEGKPEVTRQWLITALKAL